MHDYLAKLKKVTLQGLILAGIGTVLSPALWAVDADPDAIIQNDFWGKLYKSGGETFYCKNAFESQTPLLSESYVYSKKSIQEHLKCGSSMRCKKNSATYRKIISDLHNIVPTESYFEFKRGEAVFGALDNSVPVETCGMRRRAYFIEPADDIKGDIARIVLYMHTTYELPLTISFLDLSTWNQMDPPSPAEKKRDEAIANIQGKGNPFVASPMLINNLQN